MPIAIPSLLVLPEIEIPLIKPPLDVVKSAPNPFANIDRVNVQKQRVMNPAFIIDATVRVRATFGLTFDMYVAKNDHDVCRYTWDFCLKEGHLLSIKSVPVSLADFHTAPEFFNAQEQRLFNIIALTKPTTFRELMDAYRHHRRMENLRWMGQVQPSAIYKSEWRKIQHKRRARLVAKFNLFCIKHNLTMFPQPRYRKPIYHPLIDMQCLPTQHEFIKTLYHPLVDYETQQIHASRDRYVYYLDLKIVTFGGFFSTLYRITNPTTETDIEKTEPKPDPIPDSCPDEDARPVYDIQTTQCKALEDTLGYKICERNEKKILVVLKLPKREATLVMGEGPKYRTNLCVPIQMYEFNHNLLEETKGSCHSTHDPTFEYTLYECATVPFLDMNHRVQCGKGLHFFLDLDECFKYWRIPVPENVHILK